MAQEELEIILRPDGTTQIKVARSKRNCHDASRPFEEAVGEVAQSTPIANPGASEKTGQGLKASR